MAQVTLPEAHPARAEHFGETARKDNWWLGPLLTFLGLLAFVIYATYRAFDGNYFEIRQARRDFNAPGNHVAAPYLSPFYSPLIYDAQSPHAWITKAKPSWWPGGLAFSTALLILWGPVLFRFTCYYYRKAYYRSFWADPVACAVGEPRQSYWGERYFPLVLQNVHRYTLYIAIGFLFFLWWDVILAFWWPVYNAQGTLTGHHLGIGVGTLIMLANIILLTGFTLGCNSLRHLVGGRLNCFSCPARNGQGEQKLRTGYYLWNWVSRFNAHHMEWAWLSLFSVGFTDFYIMMCSRVIWSDLHWVV
jgi:hypothetical protein